MRRHSRIALAAALSLAALLVAPGGAQADYPRKRLRDDDQRPAPGGPHSGQLLHAGTGTRRQMAASIVRHVSVAAFAVDLAGNVSPIATATGDAPAG